MSQRETDSWLCKGVVTFLLAHRHLQLRIVRATRLEPKMLRLVHAYPGAEAELSLVEARRDGQPGLQILAPLFVYQARGGPLSPSMEAIYRSPALSDVRSGGA